MKRLIPFCYLLAIGSSLPIQETCQYSSPNVTITWEFNAASSSIYFSLNAQRAQDDYWTGIFFQKVILDAEQRVDFVSGTSPSLQSTSIISEFTKRIDDFEEGAFDADGCLTISFPGTVLPISSTGNLIVPETLSQYRICNIESSCQSATASKASGEKEQILDIVKRDNSAKGPVCNWMDGSNTVHWEAVPNGIKFNIQADVKKGKYWTAIAVGESMGNLKMAVAFTDGNKVKQVGGYTSSGWQPPAKAKDLKVTLNKKGVKAIDSKLSYEFIMPADVFKAVDSDGCLTLQFGINAGQYAGNFQIHKHEATPTPMQVCNIQKCSADDAASPAETVEEGSGAVEEGSGELPPQPASTTASMPASPPSSQAPQNPGNIGVTERRDDPLNVTMTSATIAAISASNEPNHDPVVASSAANPNVASSVSASAAPEALLTSPAEVKATTEKPAEVVVTTEQNSGAVSPSSSGGELGPLDESKTSGSGSSTRITVHPCKQGQTDLRVCHGYFADYLGKVEQWAQRHGETVGAQLWKACSLLAGVQHVPTMCCTEFHSTCREFIQDE
ncbi:unnamed protein product, partial [Mesorhabditis spiculigera]